MKWLWFTTLARIDDLLHFLDINWFWFCNYSYTGWLSVRTKDRAPSEIWTLWARLYFVYRHTIRSGRWLDGGAWRYYLRLAIRR